MSELAPATHHHQLIHQSSPETPEILTTMVPTGVDVDAPVLVSVVFPFLFA